MGWFTRNGVTVKVPKVKFVSNGYRLDAGESIGYGFLAGLGIIALFLIGGLVFFWVSTLVHKAEHPPKVVTHIVYQSAMTGVQQAYIQQCKSDENSNDDYGIPDVHSSTWTCTYPSN